MAENIRQISNWTLKGFRKDQEKNVELFLKLTRKDLDELLRFPLPRRFVPTFKKFCAIFDKLEAEYRSGSADHRTWATSMESCAQDLTKQPLLV